MRLPSPGLHCLRCNVPSVRRGIQHLADIGDVRQGGFTRCRLRSRYWAVFGAWRTSRPILGSPWGGRRLLASCPQAELARKYALHQGEEVGYDIAYGAALAARLQLVEYFLAMLRRQPQGGLHVLCWSAWALLRQGGSSPTAMPNGRRLRARGTYVLFIHIRLICTALLSRHVASVSGLLRNKRAASGIARQWQWVGCFALLRRRRRGKSSSSRN